MNLFPDLILIEKLPKVKDILKIELFHSFNLEVDFDKSGFLKAFGKAKAIDPNDEILSNWSYSPWIHAELTTSSGNYKIELFLGGLGIISLPDGKRGAVMFDLNKFVLNH